MDTKEQLINWQKTFQNAANADSREHAIRNIADLCDKLPDNDRDKIKFVKLAVDFSNEKEKVKPLLKKLVKLAYLEQDIHQKINAYRSIVKHNLTEPVLRESMLNSMITLLSPGAPLPRASIDVQTANDKKNTSEKDDEPDVSETVSFEELLRTEEARSKPSAADISIAEAEKQLDGLIGLSRAKQQIKTFINQYKLNQLRQKEGLSVLPINLHMVFIGNPGTGKTTVARLFGKYLKAAGILPQGHTVEISGNELTSKWMGETDKITRKKLRESLGGVLFIDEAYSIVAETSINGENGGEPIIAELLKYMEDHNGEFMLIVAGYPDEMHKFVHFNPGLKSRFRSTIVFENFSSAELVQVYHSFAKEYQYNLAGGCDEVLSRIMSNASLKYAKSFGNGRFVRNLFEKTLERIANRLAVVTGPTRNDLEMITPFDIASAAEELERENKFGKKH